MQEKKVLAIIATVLATVALLGSWIPIVNNASFVIALPALILGIIALISNRKRTKTLSLIGTILSILTIIIVLVTQSIYGNALNKMSDTIDKASSSYTSSVSSSQEEVDHKFTWTKSEFDSLVVGDSLTGTGGTNYTDIVAKYGEPTTSSESTTGD
ncbi:DUF4190 domain-containing protein [Streptococcus dentiloxodontae]